MSSPVPPSLKVTYFDIPGRAEVTRLLLHYGGIAFEDERVTKEQFLELRQKEILPFNQLPVLHVDNKTVVAQSEAMERYAARLAGVYPADPLQAAQIDMTIGAFRDVVDSVISIVYKSQDEADKQAKTKKLLEETIPRFFGGIEKYATESAIHGETLSYADFALYALVKRTLMPKFEQFSLSKDYPKLDKIVNRVHELPALRSYLKRYE